LDQSSVPDEPHAANPSGRSSYQIKCDARDTSIPDGESVADAAFDMEMSKLRKYADDKELNLTHIFKSNAGKANGIISKPRFKTALGMAFHQYALHEELIAAISLKYGCGAPDPHAGGYLEVLWRQFVIELQQYSPPVKPAAPDPFDPRITVAMSEMRQISEESGLNLAYALQGAGGQQNGVLVKAKFIMALTTIIFPNYHFTNELLNDICTIYANANGPVDLRLGGYQEVYWRAFANDIRKVPLPTGSAA